MSTGEPLRRRHRSQQSHDFQEGKIVLKNLEATHTTNSSGNSSNPLKSRQSYGYSKYFKKKGKKKGKIPNSSYEISKTIPKPDKSHTIKKKLPTNFTYEYQLNHLQ